ncbi:MAG: class I SAM-dependent methyltransferase [Candidatus Obscuribacterales bacterium]|nr:class I SAM-dependent methyltransferase [Candidatus Obscuribacterales bacterium]
MNTTTTLDKTNAFERFSLPMPQTHPDRLATIARLFGVDAPNLKNARVLEIGCANAGNLVAAAFGAPEATFVGIDQSSQSIEKGKKAIKDAGLKNLELHVSETLEVPAELGKFDYIIIHGIFSWVSKETQNKLLASINERLTPNGIAYISYNTYPGWHFRGMIRDMMLYHAGNIENNVMKVGQARALLDFLAQSVPTENNAYGLLLRNELAFLSAQPDSYLLQDIMAEKNEPFYFHQFIERATTHGLQYLGESEFSTMLTSNFPQTVHETLRRISNEIVRTEQYMDFVRNRTFRQTLLVKSDVQINRNINFASVQKMLIASPLRPVNAEMNVQSNQPEVFRAPNGLEITTQHPLIKGAFLHMSQIWPQSISFDELLSNAITRVSTDPVVSGSADIEMQKQLLGADLLTAYAANLVIFRTEAAPFVTKISERPKASELARMQAPTQNFVTNQFNEPIAIDAFAVALLGILNGKRDHVQILDELVEMVRKGQLNVQKDGKPIADNATLRQTLQPFMDECLDKMAKAAVLVG